MKPTLEEVLKQLYADYPENYPHLTIDQCIESVYWIMIKEMDKIINEKQS